MNKDELHVLLVEDDNDHADLLTFSLMESPLKMKVIHRVSDGCAALDYLFRRGEFADPVQSPRPRLILLDLRLPKMDGLMVLKEIKTSSHEELQRIPVVILTSSEAEKDITAAYACGANSYIVKPVDYERFHRLVTDMGHYWLAWNRPAA
jgi:CheY-like chemotaxis protein